MKKIIFAACLTITGLTSKAQSGVFLHNTGSCPLYVALYSKDPANGYPNDCDIRLDFLVPPGGAVTQPNYVAAQGDSKCVIHHPVSMTTTYIPSSTMQFTRVEMQYQDCTSGDGVALGSSYCGALYGSATFVPGGPGASVYIVR